MPLQFNCRRMIVLGLSGHLNKGPSIKICLEPLDPQRLSMRTLTKIDCSEAINRAKNDVVVEKIQKYGGLTVTLHKVEFSDKNTRVYLTVAVSYTHLTLP